MSRFQKIKDVWTCSISCADMNEIEEQVDFYKNRYPEAIVGYIEEDYGEWIDYDDEDRVGEGYYSEYYLYWVTLKFKNKADEAAFILIESL